MTATTDFSITLLRAETRYESVSLAPLTVFVWYDCLLCLLAVFYLFSSLQNVFFFVSPNSAVRYGNEQWQTERRFSQFAQLESELRDFYPQLPRFPPKSLTFFKSKLDEAAVQRRLDGLQQFLNELLKTRQFRESAIVLDFIQRGNEVTCCFAVGRARAFSSRPNSSHPASTRRFATEPAQRGLHSARVAARTPLEITLVRAQGRRAVHVWRARRRSSFAGVCRSRQQTVARPSSARSTPALLAAVALEKVGAARHNALVAV